MRTFLLCMSFVALGCGRSETPPPAAPRSVLVIPDKSTKQKWSIQLHAKRPAFGDAGSIRDILIEDIGNIRYSVGKPRVENGTIYYKDWDTGAESVWVIGPSEVTMEALTFWKD